MSLVINTNLNALAAQNSAGMASKAQSKAMQRLSTGLSINSAADDAAGLAISNRMTSNINGLGKAIKNANDGINMAQTADSALSNTTSILQRMRELAVQASNGSNSDANRQSIQAEVSQLKTQIDQIATSTNFNDINLLDGSAGKIQLQVGINQGQTMNMNFDSTLTKDIGIGSRASLTSIGKSTTAMAYGDLTINGVQVGPSLPTTDTLSFDNNGASAISKAAAINAVTAQTGVVATVSGTSVAGVAMSASSTSGTITINGVQTAGINTTTDSSISRQTVVQAINNISSQTGVTAVDTGDSVHGVQLFAADGRNITVNLGSNLTAQTTGLNAAAAGTPTTYSGTFQLSSPSNSPITLGSAVGGNIANADLSAGTYSANTAQVISASRSQANIQSNFATLDLSAVTLSGATGIPYTSVSATLNGTATALALTGTDTTLSALAADLQHALAAATTGGAVTTGATVTASGTNLIINTGSTSTAITAISFAGAHGVTTTPANAQFGTSTAVSTATGQLDGSALKLNGVVIGAAVSTDDTSSDTTAASSVKSESAIAIAAAINKSTNLTGVTAVAQANTVIGNNFVPAATGNIYLNGVTISNSLGANSTRADVANLLNAHTGQTGVVATDNGKGITLTAADGRNISIAYDNAKTVAATALGLTSGSIATTAVGASVATTYYAQVALQSNKQFTVQSGNSGDVNLNLLGFSTGTFGGANNGLKIAAIDVSTQTGAQNAITAIDAALVTVSANQSRAGAFINRLNDVVANQTSMQTNMTASRSSIQDTDYSAETTNLAKSQIISQAATAMLAQANQSSQNVLALLK